MALSTEWLRWRSNRRRALIDLGMTHDQAAKLAAREAKGRASIAATVGTVAAMKAELIAFGENGSRLAIKGSWDLVPPERHQAAQAMFVRQARAFH